MLAWCVENTLTAAVLTVVVLAGSRFWRRRPALEHALWLLVLVKLLAPPGLSWPWSPWPARGVMPQESVSPNAHFTIRPTRESSRQIAPDPPAGSPSRARAAEVAQDPLPEASSNSAARAFPLPRSDQLAAAALAIWGTGAAMFLLAQVIQTRRFRRLVKTAKPAPAQWWKDLGLLAERMSVRPPQVLLVKELASPLLWCLGRPRLLWPAGLTWSDATGPTNLSPSATSLLLHELAHLRRRDHWVAWLEMIAACVWWWNPLFWFVRRRLRESAELACDAWVVWALPDARRTYADSLLAMSERGASVRPIAPAWGALGQARKLERRLIMIYQNNVRRSISRGGLLLILLAALVIVPGWTRGQDDGANPQPPAAAGPAATGAPATAATTDASPAGPSGNNGLMPGMESMPGMASGPGHDMYEASPPTPPPAAARVPVAIRIFKLKHGDPSVMLPVISGLLRLRGSGEPATPGQLTVLAVVEIGPYRSGGYGGEVSMMGGEMGSYGYGMGGMMPMMSPDGQVWSGTGAVRLKLPPDDQGGDVWLTADKRTSSLIARGPKEALDVVAELVAAFDKAEKSIPQEVSKLSDVRVLTLQSRSPQEIAGILNGLGIQVQTISLAGNPYGRSAGGKLIAVGNAEDIKQLEQLVKSLDVTPSE